MRKMILIGSAISALLASLLIGSPASAAPVIWTPVPPPSDHIVIDIVTVIGSGCPAGSYAVAPAPDNTAFTVTYSNYVATVPAGTGVFTVRRNCQINILVHVPTGFTYAIAQADYRGWYSLAPRASFTESALYYFQGQSGTV